MWKAVSMATPSYAATPGGGCVRGGAHRQRKREYPAGLPSASRSLCTHPRGLPAARVRERGSDRSDCGCSPGPEQCGAGSRLGVRVVARPGSQRPGSLVRLPGAAGGRRSSRAALQSLHGLLGPAAASVRSARPGPRCWWTLACQSQAEERIAPSSVGHGSFRFVPFSLCPFCLARDADGRRAAVQSAETAAGAAATRVLVLVHLVYISDVDGDKLQESEMKSQTRIRPPVRAP